MVSRIEKQDKFAKSFVGKMNERSHLKKEKQIDLQMWRTGNHVICRKEQEVFEAEIVGFYEKSAVVVNLFNDERTVCSFRNILDPATYKPLKHTDKKHAISTGGNWETSYIPTRKEKEKWTGDILKGEPHFIRNDDLLRTYRKNKKS